MRVPFETIKEHGQRVSPHSKFYIYDDMVFEPVYRKGKKCKNYKAIDDKWKVACILQDAKDRMNIPKVSKVSPGFHGVKTTKKTKKKKTCRFDLLDL